MIKFFKNIIKLIPLKKRRKLPSFFFFSLINSFLDFISIAFLTPFILVLIDKEKVDSYLTLTYNISYKKEHVLLAIVILILFYVLKNLLQTKITFSQNKFIYSIGSLISDTLVSHYILGMYENTYQSDKGKLIHDFHRIPIIFATNILIPISNILVEITILILIVAVGVILNPLITLSAVIFVMVSVTFLFYFKRNKTKQINTIISSSYSKTLTNLMNIIDGIIEIKGSRSEHYFIKLFNQSNIKHNSTLAELSTFKQNNVKHLEIITICIISLFVFFTLMSSGMIKNMLLLSFFASSIIKVIPSFNKIINSIVDIKSNIHSIEVLSSYKNCTVHPSKRLLFKKHISINNLSFGYSEKEQIINQLNLEITSGDFIVITGASGCGKTTLLLILAGYLNPVSGFIYIDKIKIEAKNYSPYAYLVSQQSHIFQGTLLNNITMNNDENINMDYIYFLIEQVGLKKWVANLPKGIYTNFNLDSKHLSGGQKQRIALTRALYTKPKLLLLDEATNQLNTELESQILSFLKEEALKMNMTIVSVFHNHDAIKYASKHYQFKEKRLIAV